MDICRYIYNIALETKIRAWESAKINLSEYELSRQLTDAIEHFQWVANAPRAALEGSLKRLDSAFSSFFRGAGFPKFKSKRGQQTFQCRNNLRKVDFDKSLLSISRIHNIPVSISRKFTGKIKTISISKTKTGKYFASILVDDLAQAPIKPQVSEARSIGIDVGIKSFIATSDGRFFQPNQHLKNNLQRLNCLQRRLSKKKKGSNNRSKSKIKVSLLYEKIANQRSDYIHKITTDLLRDNQADTFVIEDLNLCGLLRNRKLSRSIADASFGELVRQLKYKAEWYGKNILVINRFAPSSKRCSDCGTINQELTLSDREWSCSCGSHHDRDLNAAKNIKYFGLQTPVGSREEPVESSAIVEAKKQEVSLL